MLEWKDEIRRQLAGLRFEPTREEEIVEELVAHLHDRYTELLAGGATPGEAERRTLAELGEGEVLQRALRRLEHQIRPEPIVLGTNRRSNMLSDLWHDLRFGVRMLLKNPGFTTVVVLTLALGIGVNTVFLTLFGLVFRPLPVRDPERIVNLEYRGARDRDGLSYREYVYFRDHAEVLSDLIAASGFHNLVLGNQAAAEEAQLISGQFFSDNFFSTLGTNTVLGRTVMPDQNRNSEDLVAVLSYPFWRTRFAADPNIAGQTIRLNGKAFEVIGVADPGFVGLGLIKLRVPDVWLPLMTRIQVLPQEGELFNSLNVGWVNLSGRLKPGRTREEASAEMTLLAGQLAKVYPESDPTTRILATSSSMLGDVPRGAWAPMSVILAAALMVLLIGCSNIANLHLARAVARQKEIGVRLCLGASRGRVIRQLLTESLLLAFIGGIAGLLLSWWSLKTFLATVLLADAPTAPSVSTLIAHLNPDLRILVSTTLLSLLAGIAFGLVPAIRVSRAELVVAIKDEGTSFGDRNRRTRLRSGLVIAQVALSIVLLIAAGLLLHAVIRAGRIDPRFKTKNVLRLQPRVEAAGYDAARSRQVREELSARLESMPGVTSVCRALRAPFRGVQTTTITLREETPAMGGRTLRASYNAVTPNYFQTVGIPLMRGRGFTEEEMRTGAPVVVVTESTAQLLWPNQDPLGRLLQPEANADFAEVVGVTQDAQTVHLGEFDAPFLYLPLSQRRGPGELLVETSREAREMKPLMQAVTQQLDPNLVLQAFTLEEDIANQGRVVTARLAFRLAAGLGLLALLLAAVGLYSVVAYLVSQRTREIGIRLALGAQPRNVIRLILGQGMRLVGIGIVLGIVAGAAVTRMLSSLLFGLSSFDPITYLSVSVFMAAVAALSICQPVRRATRVDPMTALRCE